MIVFSSYNGTFQGNLTVSAGQNCVFTGGAINGNVTLNGGNLSLSKMEARGNVQLNGGGTFSIGPFATINGNLQVQNVPAVGQDEVCDTQITSDLQFQNNAAPLQVGSSSPTCTENTIRGNLTVQNNTAATIVDSNTVGGNLQDQNNTASTQVFNNTYE